MHGHVGLADPQGPCVMRDSTKLRSSFLILARGSFRGHQSVVVFGGIGFALVLKYQEDAGVGQPSLLEFNDICEGVHASSCATAI